MRIYLRDQQGKFNEHLTDLLSVRVMQFDKAHLPEKVTSIKINTLHNLSTIDLDFLFNYNIFPSSILTYKTQWQLEKRTMKVGDTIVQQVFIPPLKTLSQKLIFGVRINRIIDEPHRKGFSYETLEGHVERGESTFVIEQQHGQTIFKIQTYSAPSSSFVKILGSWAALPYQRYCTRMALRNVKRQIEG